MLAVLQIDTDMSECGHHKGRHQIVDKDITEGLLTRMEWEHQNLKKTKSATEVWGNDHHATVA